MDVLDRLKNAESIQDLAAILNFRAASLAYVVFKIPVEAKYSSFDIPKRSGGVRTISAPCPQLKQLQSSLSDLLQACQAEAEQKRNVTRSVAHGFRRGCSIATNAQKHRNRRFVLSIDLENFFGEINFGRVRGFFISNSDFLLKPKVATLIAQIACHENALPQGSPSSPIISNLVGHILDMRLVRLAKAEGCTYTRYADDLTFSTNAPEFSAKLAVPGLDPHTWTVGKQLQDAIESCGFKVNGAKTRLQYRDSRQCVTGLVSNKRVNTPKEFRNSTRVMTHRLFKDGAFELKPTKGSEIPVNGTLDQLQGRFGFQDYIDRFAASVPDDAEHWLSRTNLFGALHFFRSFYFQSRPLVLSEGKTDRIHLRCAIDALAASHPALIGKVAGAPTKWEIEIHKLSAASARFHGLNGGTGTIANFIRGYSQR